ncbi:hypothetical protein PRZ48_009418 [Zasmidium cellare]|uniref:Epoxide hydrolase N-terminal domain-containing protein n=1 Tax=Zasmidium cellare TaxID=395010 RepID=A0ABR0ECW1_ZASCE|nr:hypothetical protein PRZ48_009418 [Zasmidium cellare]
MADFSKVPSSVTLDLKPFKAHVDEQALQDFKQLIKLSPVGPRTFENSGLHGSRYGITNEWLVKAKDQWINRFDWRKHEDHINSYPNFTARVKDFNEAGHALDIHFIALFSQKKDATPLLMLHGWPGSVLEFTQILDILKEKYTPATLPYHVIVPSLPGYAYSSGPPLDSDWAVDDSALVLDKLMTGLGLTDYIVQGGDIGSHTARSMATNCSACKGIHLNMCVVRPKNAAELPLLDIEKKVLSRNDWFMDVASAYALMHGTRTATVGAALSASPMALLSWISEKFLDWSDEDPSLDFILADVSLYWFTETMPRCLYPYRGDSGDDEHPRIARISKRGFERPYISKPSGYSFFPQELMPIPISWAKTACNFVSTVAHESGGHFAALEKPHELLADVEEYIKKAF